MFRIVFWDVLPCKIIVDPRQYIPEDNSEHHTRRRENLKSHIENSLHETGCVKLYKVFLIENAIPLNCNHTPSHMKRSLLNC
jgi:hypothetical protein